MEWITRRKSAQLLAGLLTFFVTASAVAQSSPSVRAKLTSWQKLVQSQRSVVSKEKTIPNTKSAGGPGLDGGGGTGVLLSSGRLRLLDMANYEKRDLIPFDDKAYARILLKDGSHVPAAGELVKSADFFNCSDKILSAQSNPLLQYLVSKNLELDIVKTYLPLEISESKASAVRYLSARGWTNEIQSLTSKSLKSSTYPEEFQRPIASYSAQTVGRPGGTLFEQTLLISSQLYDLLSERDQCALQVHEIFRYVGNFGQLNQDTRHSSLRLLTRALTTEEIEHLTQKVMAGDPILPSEIPATEIYKLFSVASRKELQNMSQSEYQSLIVLLKELGILSNEELKKNETSLETTLILYEMWDNSKRSVDLAEQGILEMKAKSTKREQRQLRQKQIDLRDLLD